ncbi:MAG: enoyl-CoA hydratase [Bacteroidetes bacterium]|nr:MAG: enoyl-CoA hydratase [Bacteroidota bacterium]
MVYSKEDIFNFSDQVFAHLKVSENDHVLEITLDRPEKKNAMNPVMVNEIAYAMSYAHHNNDIWAVVFAANGDVFCAGADLKAFSGEAQEETNSTIPQPETEVVIGELFLQVHKPCIAKINAPAFAGAFLLIGGCTHIIASENASFSLPEVKRGIWPMQVMESLLNVMTPRKVLGLCMTGGKLDVEAAFECGLVSKVTSSAELDQEVGALLDTIKGNSPTAIRKGLEAFDALRSIKSDEKHKYLQKMLYEVIKSEDAKEGITAFKEKRKPNWTGN